MEWAAMHRPLQPPPGYEHFHTKEAVFPGLRNQPKKIESWEQLIDGLRGAWRLYKHDFYPDPEITKIEERLQLIEKKKRDRKIANLFRRGEAFANKSMDRAQETAADVAEEIQDKRPAFERLVKSRIVVLRKALHEFSEGYYETASGRRTFWGEAPYDEDLVRKDNRPVRYEAVTNSK